MHSWVPRKNHILSDFHCQIKELSPHYLRKTHRPWEICSSMLLGVPVSSVTTDLSMLQFLCLIHQSWQLALFNLKNTPQICLLVAFQFTGSY